MKVFGNMTAPFDAIDWSIGQWCTLVSGDINGLLTGCRVHGRINETILGHRHGLFKQFLRPIIVPLVVEESRLMSRGVVV
jgi:hypothetical protein